MAKTSPASAISSLPIPLAVRLVLDVVSYSNPLPPWFDELTIDYNAREELIRNKIQRYMNGERPKPPVEVLVPNKHTKKVWSTPSVNDQIILQCAVSALADKIEQQLDAEKVLSYRLNKDPNKVQLTNSQISSWKQFQTETERRLQAGGVYLAFDLEGAYSNIERTKFLAFVEDVAPGTISFDLLKCLLESFGRPERGLPLVNDSLFFLGNAYFSVIDEALKARSIDFIRFVDDYRVFGESKETLVAILETIKAQLQGIGFRINASKLKLTSAEEFLESVASDRYATPKWEEGYLSAVMFEGILEPDYLVELIRRALDNSEEYINEGYGRLILGQIRRMRLNARLAEVSNHPGSPLDKFQATLSGDKRIERMTIELMDRYRHDSNETWRLVWLLFLVDDMQIRGGRATNGLQAAVEALKTVPDPVVQLWAGKGFSGEPSVNTDDIERLHDLNYLEVGKALYGRNVPC